MGRGSGDGGGTVPNATLLPPEGFCMQMSSGLNRRNFSLIVEEHIHNQTVSMNHRFFREKNRSRWNRGPSVYQPSALPLGQTGSNLTDQHVHSYCVGLTMYLCLCASDGGHCCLMRAWL